MAADPHGEVPGRFGFDTAELHLHLAEASLLLGDHGQARAHAEASQQHIPHGRPGWAAAVLVQARGEAARGRYSDATALAHDVLDTIAAPALRETLRVRLRDLDRDLFTAAGPGNHARELRERLHTLAPRRERSRQRRTHRSVMPLSAVLRGDDFRLAWRLS